MKDENKYNSWTEFLIKHKDILNLKEDITPTQNIRHD